MVDTPTTTPVVDTTEVITTHDATVVGTDVSSLTAPGFAVIQTETVSEPERPLVSSYYIPGEHYQPGKDDKYGWGAKVGIALGVIAGILYIWLA